MKLHIAGGCGEHGRNCFRVETASQSFLVDCGVMAAAQDPWPRLSPETVPELKAVFLTHSHADHSGALNHLAELGFVVGTEVTVVSELGGNLILHVKESRIALDKTMAMRIMV